MTSVLLVEDDRELRAELCHVLEPVGYQVWEADDGASALTAFRDHAPDIVMAETEGIEFIHILQAEVPNVPIIAISGNPQYLEFSLKLGATAALLKPFSVKAMLKCLDAAL